MRVPAPPIYLVGERTKVFETSIRPGVAFMSHRYPVLGFSGRLTTMTSLVRAETTLPLSPSPALISLAMQAETMQRRPARRATARREVAFFIGIKSL
jgi:hypothetical protein